MTSSQPVPRILVVEDDPDLAKLIAQCCTTVGYAVEVATDGESGLERALSGEYAMVVLDIGLPKLDGFEVCQRLRGVDPQIPVLMLTSRAAQSERVLGLELGADDYITKPFDTLELTARIKALLRRAALLNGAPNAIASEHGSHGDGQRMNVADLVLDPNTYSASRGGTDLGLTVLEFRVLWFFAESPGILFSRDQLMQQVWGYSATHFDQTVTKLLSRLRTKIEVDPANPRILQTVRGVGYRLATPAELGQ